MNIGHSSHDQSVVDTLLIGCHKIQTIPALEVFVVKMGATIRVNLAYHASLIRESADSLCRHGLA